MKTIGLLGGMSWESTVPYYQTINRTISARLGGLHSGRIVLYSVDFHDIEQRQHAGQWDEAGAILSAAARALERAGADLLVICTNTMHRVAPAIEQAIAIPVLHIADATGDEIRANGIRTIGLLGTRFTMEQDFYRGRLERRHGLTVLLPDEAGREEVHRVIYEELCLGRVLDASRDRFRTVMADLSARGAQGIVLGCTEVAMLVDSGDAPVPLFDTATIHARAAAEAAIAPDQDRARPYRRNA